MPVIDWPDIRCHIRTTLQTTPIPNFVDDSAKIGSPRRRAITTRKLTTWSFTQIVNVAERTLLETFINTTTGGGVEDFNWTNPLDGVTYAARFDVLPSSVEYGPGLWAYDIALRQVS